MSKNTFPDVPPGRDITDAAARDAALLVRDWYEGDEDKRIQTHAIVTVVRWAIDRTRGASPIAEPPAYRRDLDPNPVRALGHPTESDSTAVQRPVGEPCAALTFEQANEIIWLMGVGVGAMRQISTFTDDERARGNRAVESFLSMTKNQTAIRTANAPQRFTDSPPPLRTAGCSPRAGGIIPAGSTSRGFARTPEWWDRLYVRQPRQGTPQTLGQMTKKKRHADSTCCRRTSAFDCLRSGAINKGAGAHLL